MEISGYVLEGLEKKLEENFAQGLSELRALLKKYPGDGEAKDLAQRLEDAGEKGRGPVLEEVKNLAHLRKLENSGGSGTLPFYRKKEGSTGTR